VENTLKSIAGVLGVEARLTGESLGEAVILYNPSEVSSGVLKQAVPVAGGDRHKFTVLTVIEEGSSAKTGVTHILKFVLAALLVMLCCGGIILLVQ